MENKINIVAVYRLLKFDNISQYNKEIKAPTVP